MKTDNKNIIFKQLFDKDSSTYTYLLADTISKEGILIDPVREQYERDMELINELGIKLKYTLETHAHADHITAADQIRKETGAKAVAGKESGVDCADILVGEADTLEFGGLTIKVIATPGHTKGCISYFINGLVFTGDTLFIRGTGRTDFQGGSARDLFNSVTKRLFSLPDETVVYPGHDYKGRTASTIAEEKKFNPRLKSGITEDEFVELMNNLDLPYPKKIHEAVPANLKCGKETMGV